MADELKKSNEQVSRGPYNRFIYGLRAPESNRQYPKRSEVFLDFIDMDEVWRNGSIICTIKQSRTRNVPGHINRFYHFPKGKSS